jgi:Tol biopolymer transport system component
MRHPIGRDVGMVRRSAHRIVVIVVSLGLAAPTTVFAIDAFRGAHPSKRSNALTLNSSLGNGSIYFRYEDSQGESRLSIVEPDGSGQRDAFPDSAAAEHEQISFSPDGMRMAYVDAREGKRGIYVANADGSDAVRLTDQVNDSWPNWSPVGDKIAFVGTRFDPSLGFCHPGVYADCFTDIYTMDADGSNIMDVTGDSGWEFDPVWSPDGTRIAFASTPHVADPAAITVMNADGSDRRTVSASNGGSDFDPRWSPDGTQIVFGGIHYEDLGLFVVGADGTDERTLLFGIGTYAVAPVWSPDGTLIAFGGNVDDYGSSEGVFAMGPDGSGITKLADVPKGWAIREIAWQPPSGALVPTAFVTGVFDVGIRGTVSGLTYGFGSLWVDGYEDPTGPGHVMRLDAETGEHLADISIGSVAPGWEVGGGGIAVGDGSVWVVGTEQVPRGSLGEFDGVDTVLVRIDPSTNDVIDRIVLGGKLAADIGIDANAVWVLFGGDDDKMEIARVDTATDEVVATIPLPEAYGHYLFSIDGAILAFTNETTETIGNSVIEIIDPSTNTLAGSMPLGAYVWPGAGDGSVWASTGRILQQIVPGSGAIMGTWPLESTGDALHAGAGGIWSIGPRGRDSISRWNPTLHSVDLSVELPAGTTPNVMTSSSDAVWILSFEATVTRIQVAP